MSFVYPSGGVGLVTRAPVTCKTETIVVMAAVLLDTEFKILLCAPSSCMIDHTTSKFHDRFPDRPIIRVYPGGVGDSSGSYRAGPMQCYRSRIGRWPRPS